MLSGEAQPPEAGLGPGWVIIEMYSLREAPLPALPARPALRHDLPPLTAEPETGVTIIAGIAGYQICTTIKDQYNFFGDCKHPISQNKIGSIGERTVIYDW